MDYLCENLKYDAKPKKRPQSSGFLSSTARTDRKRKTKNWFSENPKAVVKNAYIDPKIKSTIDLKKSTGRARGSWN
jgi:hypothetical protein